VFLPFVSHIIAGYGSPFGPGLPSGLSPNDVLEVRRNAKIGIADLIFDFRPCPVAEQ
jgi:hypothetical protein